VHPPVSNAEPADLVDQSRYPLLEREGGLYTAAVAAARADLAQRGAAELSGFVDPRVLQLLLSDAVTLSPRAWRDSGMGTAYLAAPDESLPLGHPRRWTGWRALGAVAYDLFPPSSPLRTLYEWDPLMRFVEDILGRGRLYRYADPCGALNLAVMVAGDELQWHFDQSDFVVSLALQDADEGGHFEVAPLLRSETDERYEAVSQVLGGDRSSVVRLEMTPGSLLVFEGRHSLHRVTRVEGRTDRLVALLSYDTKPGTRSSDRLRKVRYGRDPS
jgi:hypothetical protein